MTKPGRDDAIVLHTHLHIAKEHIRYVVGRLTTDNLDNAPVTELKKLLVDLARVTDEVWALYTSDPKPDPYR